MKYIVSNKELAELIMEGRKADMHPRDIFRLVYTQTDVIDLDIFPALLSVTSATVKKFWNELVMDYTGAGLLLVKCRFTYYSHNKWPQWARMGLFPGLTIRTNRRPEPGPFVARQWEAFAKQRKALKRREAYLRSKAKRLH